MMLSRMATNVRSSLSLIQRLVVNLNVTNFCVTQDPWTASFTSPGLSHESYDRDGNPKLSSLMMTSSVARIHALHRPYNDLGHTFLDWKTLTSDCLTFVSSAEFEVSSKMYDPDVSKDIFDMELSLGYVGNSSVAIPIKMYVPGDQEPIFRHTNQIVSVSKSTRKPQALPDWFKDKFKGKGVMSSGLVVKPNPRPAQTFIYKSKVAWSDTDNYNHTNYVSYLRFAVDALHAALLEQRKCQEKNENHSEINVDPSDVSSDNLSSSAIKGIREEIIQRGLKKVRICYINESREGQHLDTHVWQVDGKSSVVFCSIEKDAVPICDVTLEYFD